MTQDKKSLAEERKGTCFIIEPDLGKRCGPYFFAKTQIKFGFLIDLHYLCRILKIML